MDITRKSKTHVGNILMYGLVLDIHSKEADYFITLSVLIECFNGLRSNVAANRSDLLTNISTGDMIVRSHPTRTIATLLIHLLQIYLPG